MQRSIAVEPPRIQGRVDCRFDRVKQAFARNFVERGEIGACVCVYVGGEKVVDLWGGYADGSNTRPWEEDTIVCVMSVTKAVTALCLHTLVERGVVDLSAPVATYWPEFAQGGKQAITVDQVVSHLAGLIFPDALLAGELLDWQAATTALAAQQPEWQPGSRGAYHSTTYGYLVGEIVQRASHQPLDEFLWRNVAGPLNADFHFGVPRTATPRVADLVVGPDNATAAAIQSGGASGIGRAWRALPKVADVFNSDLWRDAVFPSANGHSNARGIARILASLIEPAAGGIALISPQTLRQIATERWFEPCAVTGRRYRYGRGFALTNPPFHPFGPNRSALGHAGAGGALGFADPKAKLSFGYAMNRFAGGEGVDARCTTLIDAAYESLARL